MSDGQPRGNQTSDPTFGKVSQIDMNKRLEWLNNIIDTLENVYERLDIDNQDVWNEIIVKNKSNELIAKCSLEDYLKRKHGDSFRQLVITRCIPDCFGGANIFNDLFYGRQF